MDTVQKDNETISLRKIIVSYIHHWKVFVIAAIISLIPAVLYLILYPKTYEMMSSMRVQEDRGLGGSGVGMGEAAGLMKSFGLSGTSASIVNIDDELAALTSNRLLKKTVLKLGLNITYSKPYSFYNLYEDCPIQVIPDSTTQELLDIAFAFFIKKDSRGEIRVKMESGESFSFSSLPASLKLKQGTFNIVPNNDIEGVFELDVSVRPAGWVAEEMSKSFIIEEYSKSSNTIELSCTDHSKKRGVDVLNVLMAEYNKDARVLKEEENKRTEAFLNDRIQGIMTELNNVERLIEAYKIKNKMTDIEHDMLFYIESMKDLRQKIIELESQEHVIGLLDTYVKDPKNKYNLIPALLTAQDGEKGGAISSYNEALIERDRVMKTSKMDNPLLEIMDGQIDKLRESVYLTIDNAKRSIQYVLSDLRNKENEIMSQMGNVPTYEREYLDYKRQQEILQGVYLILLQKREEIALSQGQERDKGLIIDYAYVKKSPIGPRKLFAAIFIFFFTLIIPLVYLFCKEQLVALVKEYRVSKKI
jgi:tyrosine-protein kinase Etk/Wzc